MSEDIIRTLTEVQRRIQHWREEERSTLEDWRNRGEAARLSWHYLRGGAAVASQGWSQGWLGWSYCSPTSILSYPLLSFLSCSFPVLPALQWWTYRQSLWATGEHLDNPSGTSPPQSPEKKKARGALFLKEEQKSAPPFCFSQVTWETFFSSIFFFCKPQRWRHLQQLSAKTSFTHLRWVAGWNAHLCI